ncbi:DMT family transporter, partial [Pyramidobacter porci]
MRSRSVIYLALAAGVFMLSASGVFAKVARAPAGIIAFYRLFFATLALLPWLLSHKNDRRELRSLSPIQYAEGALAGFFLAVHYVMWFESLRYTSVASSTVLAALQPLFSVMWGRLFLGERLSARALTGGAIAIAGSAVVGWSDFSVSSQSLWGDLLALVSGGVISLYFFCGQILRRRMGAVPYSVLSYGSSAAVLALYALFMGYPFAGYPASTWGAFLGLALVSTIGGQMVFNVLL